MAEQYLKVNDTIPIDMAVIFMVISYSRFLYIQIIITEWKLYVLCIITETSLEAAMIHLHLIPFFDPVFNLHICFFTESFHIIRITLIYSVDFVTNILFVTRASFSCKTIIFNFKICNFKEECQQNTFKLSREMVNKGQNFNLAIPCHIV